MRRDETNNKKKKKPVTCSKHSVEVRLVKVGRVQSQLGKDRGAMSPLKTRIATENRKNNHCEDTFYAQKYFGFGQPKFFALVCSR